MIEEILKFIIDAVTISRLYTTDIWTYIRFIVPPIILLTLTRATSIGLLWGILILFYNLYVGWKLFSDGISGVGVDLEDRVLFGVIQYILYLMAVITIIIRSGIKK